MPTFDVLFSETDPPSSTTTSWHQDAIRYRWLRAQTRRRCWPQVVDGFVRLTGANLDIAIDEAMRNEQRGDIVLKNTK